MPSFILDNNLKLQKEEYENFMEIYLKKKRHLELGIILDNQEQDVLDRIVALMKPNERITNMRERNKSLQMRVKQHLLQKRLNGKYTPDGLSKKASY